MHVRDLQAEANVRRVLYLEDVPQLCFFIIRR